MPMYNVYLQAISNKIRPDTFENFQYYIKVILKEMERCLNSNGISHFTGQNQTSKFNLPNSQTITLALQTQPAAEPPTTAKNEIYIFFKPGDPESKRLGEILKQQFNPIYAPQGNVKLLNTPKSSPINSTETPAVILSIALNQNIQNISWLQNNVDILPQIITSAFCEFFGIPFLGCSDPYSGTVNTDCGVYARPNLNAKTIRSLKRGQKIILQNQWENWYIVGENKSLGYVQTNFINI